MTSYHPLRYIVQYPSAGLLLIQLLGLVLYPFMEDLPERRAVFGAFGAIVLVAALRMVRRGPTLHGLAFTLAAVIVALSIIGVFVEEPRLDLWLFTLEAGFYFYATASLISYMTEDQRATTDELFAVGATFTLLAWAFAYTFMACQLLYPGSFTGAIDPQAPRSWMELLFLSITVLSGVGIGDILPMLPLARGLVLLEAIAGVMYIALVVSRLIGLTIVRR
ncbi:ion channel [Stutzerimonas stutzeri]|uniref:ion channel n=1 Tax=Stutzerimonas sp. S1 TaxID=3030652 RepID=UPI002224DAB5|nr:ion channel [Stutzerimonas sp. S1]MCW3148459.1 ion channel [Stutzerimonas sp. S1]